MGRKDESRKPTPNSQRNAIENWELAEVLDKALSQLNSGDDLERILARYPAHAGLLRPMLRAAQLIRRIPPPVPDPTARRAGLHRLLAAVEALRDERVATVLDGAVARLSAGESVEAILADSPAWADEIRPMLEAAVAVSSTPQPIPDQQKKQQAREHLLRAVAARRRTQDAARRQPQPVLETSRSFEDVLDEALTRLRAGADLEAVLARYPAYAVQMRPLLQTAQDIHRVPPPVPDEDAYFAGRARVVKLAARRRRQVSLALEADRATQVRPTQHIGRLLKQFLGVAPRLRRAALTVVLLAAMILGSFSVTHVAADSLPTSPWYPVKRLTEQVQLVLAPSTEAKAKLNLEFSQERLREAEVLARQTGKVDLKILGDMLEQNDQFLGRIKQVAPEQRRQLLTDGAEVFYRQRQTLTELSGTDSPLPASERAMLENFVGETGDDQAIAEEVQRNLGLAELIPGPTSVLLPTPALKPSPTPVPTKVKEKPVKPTRVPATATPIPPTATPSLVPPEMVLEPVGPAEQIMPTATLTATATLIPPTATSTAPPASGPITPPQPVEPTATPTSVPTATPVPPEPEVSPSPTVELVLPTLPPATPVP